jgi:hypothetical protein
MISSSRSILVVTPLDNRGHVAHKTMQQIRIGWKIIEIKLHHESYANPLPAWGRPKLHGPRQPKRHRARGPAGVRGMSGVKLGHP